MSYSGPSCIPLELAENLIEALNPILDLLTETSITWKSSKPNKYKIEENRWALWRAVTIAHEAVAGQGGSKVWRSSPIRRRYETDPTLLRMGPWWQLRCGRPTKKGEPCKMKLRFGRAYCWRHSTQEENENLRIWQDKIHLPYPRVDVGKFVYDQVELIEDLKAIVADLS